MNAVGQLNNLTDIHRLIIHADRSVFRRYGKENLSDRILRDLQIAYIKYHFLIAFNRYLFYTAHIFVGKSHLIGALRHHQKHVLRNLADYTVSNLNPAAKKGLVIFQTKISVSLIHTDTVNLVVNPRNSYHVLRYHFRTVHTASLRQHNHAFRHGISLGTYTGGSVSSCQIIIIYIVVHPCFRRTLDTGKPFLSFQESYIHHVPRLHLGNRHGAVVLILYICRPVIIQGILFSCLHIDQGHSLICLVYGKYNRRIRRIKASHCRHGKTRVNHVRVIGLALGGADAARLRGTACQSKRCHGQHGDRL